MVNLSNFRSEQRLWLRRVVLRLSRTQRIHILGAARSGTTLMHCAMAAFDRTEVHPRESTLRAPDVSTLIPNFLQIGRSHYVTKRGYSWFRHENVDKFIRVATAERIGVIYMVRHPSDVLTSCHKGELNRKYYVEPDRWCLSVQAGETIRFALEDRVPFLVIRYEDLVSSPDRVCEKLVSAFRLRLRPGAESLSRLASNVDTEKVGGLETALHRVRDFDTSSVGKWRSDPKLCDYLRDLLKSEIASSLRDFANEYDYSFEGLGTKVV
ncbi:MAG: hypothetical protein VYA84_12755 [Planctomycetota bacterium]|nr:hypothetical protein [Planctomycetota bacterium]